MAVATAHPLTVPIEAAFGRFLAQFHAQLVADTTGLAEYAARPFAKSAVWAPGRMIDQVDEMLEAWRKNDTSGAARGTPYLPIIIAAAGKDFMPVGSDIARPAGDPAWITIPDDPKGRIFKLQAMPAEFRVQLAIIAQDKHTAKSLALQLTLWCTQLQNRRFNATYTLAGFDTLWPVQVEAPDIAAVSAPTEQKNLTILTADFTLRATVPILRTPADGAADSDGQGTHPVSDPNGYVGVIEVAGMSRGGALLSTGSPWTTA